MTVCAAELLWAIALALLSVGVMIKSTKLRIGWSRGMAVGPDLVRH